MKQTTWQKIKLKVGNIVKIDYLVKEGKKERVQPFQGVVIKIGGKGEGKTLTVRKISIDGIGVERIFPLNSPLITNLKVLGRIKGRVKKGKLYYLRHRK